jgi:hypothetical protein
VNARGRRRAEDAEQARQQLEHTLRSLGVAGAPPQPASMHTLPPPMAATVSVSPTATTKAPAHMSLPSLPLSPALSSRSAPLAVHLPLADPFSPAHHNGHVVAAPILSPAHVSAPMHPVSPPAPMQQPHVLLPTSPVLSPRKSLSPIWAMQQRDPSASPHKSRGGATSWQVHLQAADAGVARAMHVVEIKHPPTVVRTTSPVRSMSPPHRMQQPMRGATITSTPSSSPPPPPPSLNQQQQLGSALLEWQIQTVTPRQMNVGLPSHQAAPFGVVPAHQHSPQQRRATSIGLTITQTAPHYVLEV